jgi:hypothetical protein
MARRRIEPAAAAKRQLDVDDLPRARRSDRQRGSATRARIRQGAACLFGAMGVSAGVQRPVLCAARLGADRRLLDDDTTVVPVGHATPPGYPAASAADAGGCGSYLRVWMSIFTEAGGCALPDHVTTVRHADQ